ncbi:RES family NAD+ phosphorylase [Micromonospora sp. STR1s_5]|nr:RES family NAD+ phosphorylase [Micromonospora sp. STR1s_5]
MKPLQDRAYEGRVNPKGIPCLYFATTREVAMSEVRPWIGSVISVARFRTEREVVVVDCSVSHLEEELPPGPGNDEEVERTVWSQIDQSFSTPVTRSDNTAEYAATQILSELFRSCGYDGILYKSAFSAEGRNVALFDLDCATQIDCTLYEVRNATYDFQPLQ